MRNVTSDHKNPDARQSLYCVWIQPSGLPDVRLVRVWIDRAMRAFESEFQEANCGAAMAASVPRAREDESTEDAVIEDPPLFVHTALMSTSLP
ncbi:MAG TPA: hypothetical protein VFN26_03830 [Candidatus Acidoferrum sp.]|nr:hypothetical protein [Candidatus Acidoferrum sp.]